MSQAPVPAPAAKPTPVGDVTLLTPEDLFLFNEGNHFHLYRKLGAHPVQAGGVGGTYFAVWAPNARSVHVLGDFNAWDPAKHPLRARGESGIWEGFVPRVRPGSVYKYRILSQHREFRVDKADPFATRSEVPPRTGSVVWDLDYFWGDAAWMEARAKRIGLQAPVSIYEVHLGSWMRSPDEGNRWLTYREIAPKLAAYARRLGFSHVELLPIMEHPFAGSWGYQCTGYFAPTSRFGTPQDFMFLVDTLHQQGIGVILDWVPSHFPSDEHALGYFDGTHLYEHADQRQGLHPEWGSVLFNYGRHEVRSFLISSAMSWIERYHADGLRVDAVASMLYLDYSRQDGGWIPNRFGGRENLEAIDFLRRLNEAVYQHHPDVQMIAEESTSWPMVSRPVHLGGLGFGYKWDMGWMHDTLAYFGHDAVHRRFHHGQLTFRMLYAFTENFVNALSHDEVVHGKGSLLAKMPGDVWQKFANLRLLLGFMFAQPGKKLLFMGDEFGQWNEWNHDTSLDWHLTDNDHHDERHRGLQRWVKDLNRAYRHEPALHEHDCDARGFAWVDCNDTENSVLSWLRRGTAEASWVLVVCNMTPVPRHGYRVGVPCAGVWREILNSDAQTYGGSGQGNLGGRHADAHPAHAQAWSLELTLPPLGVVFLRSESQP